MIDEQDTEMFCLGIQSPALQAYMKQLPVETLYRLASRALKQYWQADWLQFTAWISLNSHNKWNWE